MVNNMKYQRKCKIDNVVYELVNNHYVASGYYGNDSIITIHNRIYDLPVKSIRKYSFRFNDNIKELIIEDGVKEIGEYAFNKCNNLEIVKISNSVLNINEYAFSECINLKSVELSNSISDIANGLFCNCYKLNDIKIPEGVNRIGKSSFYNCNSLEKIDLPNTLEIIGETAFNMCYSIKDLTLPRSLKIINKNAFFNCIGIKYVIIPESVIEIGTWSFNCVAMYSEGNILFNEECNIGRKIYYNINIENLFIDQNFHYILDNESKDAVISHYCGEEKNVIIPEVVLYNNEIYKVKVIDTKSFWCNKEVNSIRISKGIREIRKEAFDGCSSLHEVFIPESVVIIEDGAIDGNESLVVYCERDIQPDSWNLYWTWNLEAEVIMGFSVNI